MKTKDDVEEEDKAALVPRDATLTWRAEEFEYEESRSGRRKIPHNKLAVMLASPQKVSLSWRAGVR